MSHLQKQSPDCEVAPCLHTFKGNSDLAARWCCGFSSSLGTCGLGAADQETASHSEKAVVVSCTGVKFTGRRKEGLRQRRSILAEDLSLHYFLFSLNFIYSTLKGLILHNRLLKLACVLLNQVNSELSFVCV